MHLQEVPLEYHTHYNPRDGARSENLSRQVVMRRAATARRRLLMPPCSPASDIPEPILQN